MSRNRILLGLGAFNVDIESRYEVIAALRKVFQETAGEASCHLTFGDDVSDSLAIENTIICAHELHKRFLYVEGACLIHKSGISVLLVGESLRGKTTLSLAAALRGSWKLQTEDVAFIDTTGAAGMAVLNFCAPLSVRSHTKILLQDLGYDAALIGDRWFTAKHLFVQNQPIRQIDYLILLDFVDAPAPEGEIATLSQVTISDAYLSLLPISNIVLQEEPSLILSTLLANSKAFKLSAGTVQQRLAALESLATNAIEGTPR